MPYTCRLRKGAYRRSIPDAPIFETLAEATAWADAFAKADGVAERRESVDIVKIPAARPAKP